MVHYRSAEDLHTLTLLVSEVRASTSSLHLSLNCVDQLSLNCVHGCNSTCPWLPKSQPQKSCLFACFNLELQCSLKVSESVCCRRWTCWAQDILNMEQWNPCYECLLSFTFQMLLLKHWTGAEPHCHSHRRALACKRCIWIRQSCCLLINTLNGFSYADTCKKSSSCAVVLQDLGISKEPKFNSCPIGCAISDPAQVLSFYYFIQLHHTISSMPASHEDTTIALSWLQVGCFNTGWFVVAMVKWLLKASRK